MSELHAPEFVSASDMSLLVDQYELSMLRAYHAEGMFDRAVFNLFVRRLPEERNFLLACGLDTVLSYLESLRFDDDALAYLASRGEFDDAFLRWLGDFRFTGDVRAVPEGTPVFAGEPLLEVEGPLPEAQLVETFIMNQMHVQTVLASKAARVRRAAGACTAVDFGLRRMHGADAGLRGTRAYHVAGLDGTSNVLAGRTYGVPVTGTMAHAYVQAHDDELDAFRAFVRVYPDTILLVDTYDTLDGVRKVVRLAEELGDDFRVRGIRLDSVDLAELARGARRILDAAGLDQVRIFASGGLDEWKVQALVAAGAPIDGFGVGTAMGVSADAPSLDMVYKLTEYGGQGRLKLSTGKPVLPGPKQLFRVEESGRAVRDVIAGSDEELDGRPLLQTVMESGRRVGAGRASLDDARALARQEMARLPDRILALETASPPYVVDVSDALKARQRRLTRTVARKEDDA